MERLERLACLWMGRHLEFVRHRKRLTATELAERMGMRVDTYRKRELGQTRISLDFLLRAQLALKTPIHYLWFPFREGIDVPDESTTEEALSDLLKLMCPVTIEQVIEAAAEAFQVSMHEILTGSGSVRANQARTAAAIIVAGIPHLRLTDLAYMVRRSPRTLLDKRHKAKGWGKDFWSRVAAVRQEVESL